MVGARSTPSAFFVLIRISGKSICFFSSKTSCKCRQVRLRQKTILINNSVVSWLKSFDGRLATMRRTVSSFDPSICAMFSSTASLFSRTAKLGCKFLLYDLRNVFCLVRNIALNSINIWWKSGSPPDSPKSNEKTFCKEASSPKSKSPATSVSIVSRNFSTDSWMLSRNLDGSLDTPRVSEAAIGSH